MVKVKIKLYVPAEITYWWRCNNGIIWRWGFNVMDCNTVTEWRFFPSVILLSWRKITFTVYFAWSRDISVIYVFWNVLVTLYVTTGWRRIHVFKRVQIKSRRKAFLFLPSRPVLKERSTAEIKITRYNYIPEVVRRRKVRTLNHCHFCVKLRTLRSYFFFWFFNIFIFIQIFNH